MSPCSRMGAWMCPAMWWTGTRGLPWTKAIPFATWTPTRSEPTRPGPWVTATASYDVTKQVKLYVEGRNLTNSIVRTYLNGDPNVIWASGSTGTSNSVGAGYTAYGRSFTAGVRFGF